MTDEFQAVILIDEITAKAVAADEKFIGYFEGIASTPDRDLEGDRFAEDVLKKNAAALVGKPILLLHGKNHELGPTPVGEVIEASYENGALKIRAGIYKTFAKIWGYVKKGLLRALSVGGVIKKFFINDKGERVIEDAEIREVSLTPRGVNPFAQITVAFGKSLIADTDLGILVEDDEDEFAKALANLRFVERDSWDADAARSRIFAWAEKEDGSIDRGKAGKLFLVVEGDGSKRADYKWPVGDVVDGEPVYVTSAIRAAIVLAAGGRGVEAPAEVRRKLETLVNRMKKRGLLPKDYVVPWKRKESSQGLIELSILKQYEAMDEELRKEIEALKAELAELKKSQPQQTEQPQPQTQPTPTSERALAEPVEAVKKEPEIRLRYTPAFDRLWRRLHERR